MKKIGLLCLCLASLSLAGCFHIPNEDWLPSKDKVKTENAEKGDEVKQAINSFIQGIDMISSNGNGLENEGNDEITEDVDIELSEKNIDNDEITGAEVENEEIEENIVSEGEI